MNRVDNFLSRALNGFMAAGLVVTGSFMVVLFGAGFLVIGQAVRLFFGFLVTHQSVTETASPALIAVLQGLEYLFVAPLAYLLFRTLIRYIGSFKIGGDGAAADREIRAIKILIMSLLISAVATDLVGKILGPSTFTLQEATPGLLAVAVFTAYLVALQRQHSS